MAEIVTSVTWPLQVEQRQLLARLAELIRRFGRTRFQARLVRPDKTDFPEPWEPTLTGVHRVLYRLCWHAYVDAEIVVEDVRPLESPSYKMLTTSTIELGTASEGRATFHVGAIGNDDVAGLLSHAIGGVFLELAPPDPFRETAREVTLADASIAAIYLGLGVLVANSSRYRRYASQVRGRSVASEELVATTGGLSIGDATFLLAVQNVLSDDVQPALAGLHQPQTEWLEQWTAALEDHEDELRVLLDLDAAADGPLVRPDRPREAPVVAEPDFTKFNHGQKTFRVRYRSYFRASLGLVGGAVGFVVPFGYVVGPVAMLAGAITGAVLGRHFFRCADPKCWRVMETELSVCPGCGGTILDTIAHERLRLERLEEIEGPPPFEE